MGTKINKLHEAKRRKNDEFYTLYKDVESEIEAYYNYNPSLFQDKVILLPCDDPDRSNFTKFFLKNFNRFGLKRLISTSFGNPQGKILDTTNPSNHSVKTLVGDGDFRSQEVTSLRDEADFIITNPPFTLFLEFWDWAISSGKRFSIIGNKLSVVYKEVFPLLKDNKVWGGYRKWAGGMWFETIKEDDFDATDGETKLKNVSSCWLTNIEHSKRHTPLVLNTMDWNIRENKHKAVRELGYQRYDNYDALEIPYVDAIPSDYDGVMGVPISFLDKYCPEQFEILRIHFGKKRFFRRASKSIQVLYQHCSTQQRWLHEKLGEGDTCANHPASGE